jgi:ATP-dependent Zn protease
MYTGANPLQPAPRRGRSLFGWVLFIGLAIMLFFLLSHRERMKEVESIPLSDFKAMFDRGEIASVVVHRNELTGELAQATPGVNHTHFRTPLPEGLSSDWQFLQWLLDRRRNAEVSVHNDDNVLLNILLPLVPWVLIFGFIWFFVFRQLRKANASGQQTILVTGPGRWVPDEPGPAKAGQP